MRRPLIRIAETDSLLEPAVYHADVREDLILLDAHNGATSCTGISTLIRKLHARAPECQYEIPGSVRSVCRATRLSPTV